MIKRTRAMTDKNGYLRTDLAAEAYALPSQGISETREQAHGFPVHRISVSIEKKGYPPKGDYITAELGKLWLLEADISRRASELLSELIKELSAPYFDPAKKNASVMTVCLGNRRMIADAVGPLCAEGLIVTRHLKDQRPDIFEGFGNIQLSSVTAGVMGDTGIEAAELALSVIGAIKPQMVIAIDALAAKCTERLCSSVQLSNAGISPGSGIGNRRQAISYDTLGVPVISIGVPTVVHSSALIWNALEKANITEVSQELESILENEKSFFVMPKDADIAVTALAKVISNAVNLAFLGIPELS